MDREEKAPVLVPIFVAETLLDVTLGRKRVQCAQKKITFGHLVTIQGRLVESVIKDCVPQKEFAAPSVGVP